MSSASLPSLPSLPILSSDSVAVDEIEPNFNALSALEATLQANNVLTQFQAVMAKLEAVAMTGEVQVLQKKKDNSKLLGGVVEMMLAENFIIKEQNTPIQGRGGSYGNYARSSVRTRLLIDWGISDKCDSLEFLCGGDNRNSTVEKVLSALALKCPAIKDVFDKVVKENEEEDSVGPHVQRLRALSMNCPRVKEEFAKIMVKVDAAVKQGEVSIPYSCKILGGTICRLRSCNFIVSPIDSHSFKISWRSKRATQSRPGYFGKCVELQSALVDNITINGNDEEDEEDEDDDENNNMSEVEATMCGGGCGSF